MAKNNEPKGTSINIGGNVSGNIVVGNNNTVGSPSAQPEKPLMNSQVKVFISYRRADSADVVGRIYDSLVEALGSEAVFKDVNAIPLGSDFRTVLMQAIEQCTVFVAVIGKNWLMNEKDEKRLNDPQDWVRIEIESALQREIPVIPLLVQGASMPSEQDLPASLKPLVFKNAAWVRPDPDFHHDMQRLISALY